MARKRNPRRIALDMLRDTKTLIALAIERWDVPGTVYVALADRKPGDNLWRRKREAHEYPENQAVAWARLADDMTQAIRYAEFIRAYAEEQRAELSRAALTQAKRS